jgi:isoquinoline 1-oxidoreductase alpha subunit
MIHLNVNGKSYSVQAPADVPLLWVLRERLGLWGTKFGCGIGLCGSCTVHVDGIVTRSCMLAAGEAEGKKVLTIEGLPEDHPVKRAWVAEQVPQCGYCQPGQIMQATALLAQDPDPSDETIRHFMEGNLCRCGTYPDIRRAIRRAARERKKK